MRKATGKWAVSKEKTVLTTTCPGKSAFLEARRGHGSARMAPGVGTLQRLHIRRNPGRPRTHIGWEERRLGSRRRVVPQAKRRFPYALVTTPHGRRAPRPTCHRTVSWLSSASTRRGYLAGRFPRDAPLTRAPASMRSARRFGPDQPLSKGRVRLVPPLEVEHFGRNQIGGTSRSVRASCATASPRRPRVSPLATHGRRWSRGPGR